MSENNESNKSRSDSSEVNNDLMKSNDDNNLNSIDNEERLESDSSESKKPIVEKVLNESKDKSKYRNIESRYQQSAKEWTNKRNDDSIQSKSKEMPTKSGKTSKPGNPTPNSKTRLTKASTPVSTNKSLNCSGVSVITAGNDKAKVSKFESNRKINRYGKGLTTKRQSIVSKRELYPSLQSDSSVGTSRVPMSLLPAGQDSQTKNKEIEKSIIRSIYLKSVLLNVKAKQIKKQRDSNAIIKISEIWNINNELRLKLQSTQNSLKAFEKTIQSIEILQKQKQFLEKYINLRKQLDPLYNSFAQLIDKQKLLFKIQNCSQKDFEKLNDLLKSLPELKQMESFEELSKASLEISEFSTISSEISSLKAEFNEKALELEELIKKKQQYDLTEKSINDNESKRIA